VLVGVLIVAFVGWNQLGSRVTGTFEDPAIAYPAAFLDGSSLGMTDAKVTMEVYEDFQCPVCARYSLEVEPVLFNKYVQDGTLRIVHNDIGILGDGTDDDESVLTAVGAACALDQGRYWDYSHWVYNNQEGENRGGFRRERLVSIAEAAGLDGDAFEACLDDAATRQAVLDAANQALGMGINSTPTIKIGDQVVSGLRPASELGALIEAAAGRGASASPTN
jgi:protein-disulfide isomerase